MVYMVDYASVERKLYSRVQDCVKVEGQLFGLRIFKRTVMCVAHHSPQICYFPCIYVQHEPSRYFFIDVMCTASVNRTYFHHASYTGQITQIMILPTCGDCHRGMLFLWGVAGSRAGCSADLKDKVIHANLPPAGVESRRVFPQ